MNADQEEQNLPPVGKIAKIAETAKDCQKTFETRRNQRRGEVTATNFLPSWSSGRSRTCSTLTHAPSVLEDSKMFNRKHLNCEEQ
jgi:hypothetical protein